MSTQEIIIQLKTVSLLGLLTLPQHATGLVIFAHGSGSGRLSPRNQYVANALNEAGFATCLFDLLTEQEEHVDASTLTHRFNITLLASRLADVTAWLSKEYQDDQFQIGYFGASTGAAAALMASAITPLSIKAIVSRGGRPDLAGSYLGSVVAPTLLIVGSLDSAVIDLNKNALSRLPGTKALSIVANATHLFEEPGALDEVIALTIQWFKRYLEPCAADF